MAHKLILDTPVYGMTEIVTVTKKVGPECFNLHADVELVQRLLNLALPGSHAQKLGFGLPKISGKFEPLTGFYIFLMQRNAHKDNPLIEVDGCVSKATSAGGYSAGALYTIVDLNLAARARSEQQWKQLVDSTPLPPPGVQ